MIRKRKKKKTSPRISRWYTVSRRTTTIWATRRLSTTTWRSITKPLESSITPNYQSPSTLKKGSMTHNSSNLNSYTLMRIWTRRQYLIPTPSLAKTYGSSSLVKTQIEAAAFKFAKNLIKSKISFKIQTSMATREVILFKSTLRNPFYTKTGSLTSELSLWCVPLMVIYKGIGIKKVISVLAVVNSQSRMFRTDTCISPTMLSKRNLMTTVSLKVEINWVTMSSRNT